VCPGGYGLAEEETDGWWRYLIIPRDAQRIVFMGTSFSVNITSIALRTALTNEAAIEVVDPQPIDLGYERIEYHKMTAAEYVSDRLGRWFCFESLIYDIPFLDL
jgi:hypothetical protein